MKKTFSITIGGQIFHIEEDGYEQLRRYLDSIQKYFASFPDSFEIVSDVESRIAELLQGRLQAGMRQAITLEDVQYVQATMGTVEDFMAADAADSEAAGSTAGANAGQGAYTGYAAEGPGRIPLVKDKNDKILTGVCAGLAGWLKIDPLWVRILAVCLFFGIWFFPPVGGTVLIVYIILAIALPEGEVPASAKPSRRFYRDPETKVLGGVAGGMAAYFGTDLGVMRAALAISVLLGGFGLVLYIVLWVSTRYAITPTERLQMRGNPVTLSGIEQSLKDNLSGLRNTGKPGEPSVVERILLLPFQIIATLFKAIGPLLRVMGIIIGSLLLIFLGIGLFVLLVLGINVLRGGWDPVSDSFISMDFDGYDVKQFLPIMPPYLGVMGLVLLIIPMVFLMFLAIALIVGRWRVNRYASWSLLGIWFLCLVLFTAQALPFAQRFSEDQDYVAQTTQTMPAGPLEVNTREVGGDRFRRVSLRLKAGKPGDTLIVVQSVTGHGATDEAALRSAKAIRYGYTLERNTLALDDHYTLKSPKDFAVQEAEFLLIVPQGRPFKLSHDAIDALDEPTTLVGDRWKWDADEHTVQFNEEGKLECLDCPPKFDHDDEDYDRMHDAEDLDERDDRERSEEDRHNIRIRIGEDEKEERVYRDSAGSVRMTISTDPDETGIHMDVKENQGKDTKRVIIKADKNGVKVDTREK